MVRNESHKCTKKKCQAHKPLMEGQQVNLSILWLVLVWWIIIEAGYVRRLTKAVKPL